MTRQVGPRERLLLVGTSATGLALARELHEREELGVQIVGVVDTRRHQPRSAGPAAVPRRRSKTSRRIVRARAVDRVVVSLADARGKLPMDKLLEMKLDGVTFDHLASVYEEYTGKIAVENLRPSWLIFSPGFRKTRASARRQARARCRRRRWSAWCSRAPIMLVLAAIVKLTSPGPVFYSQRRVGRDGRVFTVYKLRSMCVDAERDTGPVWARARRRRAHHAASAASCAARASTSCRSSGTS